MTDQEQGPEPRYRLDRRIATGGMGEVWRATDTVLGREVAVKVLKPEHADDPTFRSRFQTEARHAAALHHPNVATVFDFGELPAEDGSGTPRPFLVMELVPGQALSTLLRADEPMPSSTAADLVAQACDAVAAAHAIGVVHRDIKPGNLLVTPGGQVKITDFGIARAADTAGLTMTGQVIGTPAYFSPEQAEGKPATRASDVYSLGVVLYECLAGRRPFIGETPIGTAMAHLREEPPPLPDGIPEHLQEAVAVALAKDPADRFASAADLAAVLRGGPMPGALAGAAGAGALGAAAAAAGAAGAAGAAAGAAGAAGAASAAGPSDGTQVMTAQGAADPPRRAGPPAAAPGPARRRRPSWLPWLAAAAAVLLVIALVAWLGQGDEPTNTTDDPASSGTGLSTPSDPTTDPTTDPTSEEPNEEPAEETTPTEEPAEETTPSEEPTQSPEPTEEPTESPEPTEEPTESPEPTEEPTESPEPTVEPGVEIVAEDYIGLTKDDAEQRLEDLGLEVDEEKVENPGDAAEDTVAAISPTGTVQEGDEIILSIYDKVKGPPQDPPGQDDAEDD